MKRALITGITGQDGSYLAELLIEKGYEVHGVIRRTSSNNTGRINHLLTLGRVKLHYGDMADYFSLYKIIAELQPDEIYNLAAQSHVHISFDQPQLTFDVNMMGHMHILEAVRMIQYHPRIYFAATSEMFGDNFYNHPVFGKCQNEETAFAPNSPYAISKMAAFNLNRVYRKSYDLYTTAGILFNHSSPRRGHNFVEQKIVRYVSEVHSISKSFGCTPLEALADGRIQQLALGNLNACRDFGYSRDYVEAMWLIVQADEPDDYVIATGKTYTISQLLDKVFAVAGVQNWGPFIKVDSTLFRPNEVPFLCGDSSKARIKLGWEPKVGLDQLIRIMFDSAVKSNYPFIHV